MTDEFVTKGLQQDRYLKAVQLISQFEDEIEATLLELDRRMVEKHPDLFDSSDDPGFNTNRTPGNGLALHRINHPMNGPRAPEDGQTRRLNVHLYWMPPTEYGRTDVDGAVRGFGYKIKYADQAVDNRVVDRTRDGEWPLETSNNPYDSNTAFYRHVSSAADIEETADTLVSHFAEFGGEYAQRE